MSYLTVGRHVAVDFWGIAFDILDDFTLLSTLLTDAAEECGAEVLGVTGKSFVPYGVTVLVLLSESHISIHTYPEDGFAGVDCYTCGVRVDPQVAINFLINTLKPAVVNQRTLIRGRGMHDPIEVL